jgi:hypothetical protein
MSEKGTIFSYTGPVDFRIIDQMLKKLKSTASFKNLDRTIAKRIYAILVELLENIAKHSASGPGALRMMVPSISVMKDDDKIVISSANPVLSEKSDRIARKLNKINRLNENELLELYEEKINTTRGESEKGAGLGFMLMKLKSLNRLEYRIINIDRFLSRFEIEITVKKYIMRKLVIDPTSNSPKVVLDPEKKVFEISGESRPPDVSAFYNEILNWMDDYSVHLAKSGEHPEPVVFKFDLEYFNSSSAKYLLDFCKQVAGVNTRGKPVKVNWHYEEGDMDMLEVGREMSRMAKIPFEYIQKEI